MCKADENFTKYLKNINIHTVELCNYFTKIIYKSLSLIFVFSATLPTNGY